MFPLTRTVRESLVQLACASMAQQGPAAASIRGRQGLNMRPESSATITSAPVVGILLQLLQGYDDAAERNATLEAMHFLIGEHGTAFVQSLHASSICPGTCWIVTLLQRCVPGWSTCQPN